MILSLIRFVISERAKKLRAEHLKALKSPKKSQQLVLKQILDLAGKDHLPEKPTEYSDYKTNSSWTKEAIVFFEPTSGSSGPKKLIPYTPSLLKTFENMFLIWLDDIFKNNDFEIGKLFISISPQIQSLGTYDDTQYLSWPLRLLLRPFLVVSPKLQKAKDGHEFYHKVSVKLLQCSNLEAISIWSPTYLLCLLEWMQENINTLEASGIQAQTLDYIRTNNWCKIWSKLKFISVWDESYSSEYTNTLKEIFPNIKFQGKGLLCTEGPITIPWGKESTKVPLWNEVYLEYIDDFGAIKALTEIQKNESGVLLISTKGGALRYNLKDKIQCTGFFYETPIIKFCGKEGQISDLVGEKIQEDQVYKILKPIIHGDWLMLPEQNKVNAGYVLFVEEPNDPIKINDELRSFYHYRLAQDLGQLEQLKVYKIKSVSKSLELIYRNQISLGDQKKKYLITRLEDSEKLLKNLNL